MLIPIKDRIRGFLRNTLIKEIMIIASPIILENIFQVTMGLADNYFVSKLGSEYIAGVGITNLIVNIYMSIFFAIGVSTTALVSRYLGAYDKENASKTAQHSFLLSIVIGLTLGLANIIFYKQILSSLGLKGDLIEAASPYFISITGPIVFLSMLLTLSSGFRAFKNTKTTMKISIVSNLINIVLDPILIFGFGGLPGLGIVGAGIATSLSRLFSVLLMMHYSTELNYGFTIKCKKMLELDYSIFKNLIRLGAPVATERLFMRIGQVIYSAFIIGLGTEVYAAYVITSTLDSYAYIPGMAIGAAASALVGNSLGSGDKDQAFEYGVWSLFIGLLFMVGIGIINFALAPLIGSIFSNSANVISNIVLILRLMLIIEPVSAVSLIITPVLQGAGDTKFPMIYTMLGIWIFRVAGIYLFVEKFKFGIIAVLIMVFLDLFMRSTLLIRRFIMKKWQLIEIY